MCARLHAYMQCGRSHAIGIDLRHGGNAKPASMSRDRFRHGAFCFGLSWLLMPLLFAPGVMNLVWTATVIVFVLLDNVVPRGRMMSRRAGLLMIGWGVWLAATRFYQSTYADAEIRLIIESP